MLAAEDDWGERVRRGASTATAASVPGQAVSCSPVLIRL